MHPLLQGEEKLHLEALKKEAKDICLQLKDSVFRMAQYRESLREMYGELTGMCHKLDTELLQALGNILQTTDLAEMQKPQPMNPELTYWRVSGILDMLNNFRVDNILSQTTTIHHAILDDASVMFSDNDHGASRQPRVVEGVVSWEAQAFSSGRHYWEVFVTQSSSWILGVSKDILVSDTNFSIYSEEAFVLFSKKMNDHYILFTNSLPLVQFVKKPLSRIGVFLDYDNGAVSCYDAFRSSFIYSFLPSSLSSPLKPFLSLGSLCMSGSVTIYFSFSSEEIRSRRY
ncbi:tripartite motif-containing protein 64C-like [Bos indicus x Bos taurus]|uniref:tripartite motif-containing protein 64C-like n=1 Tax=Bos indicus x Bos taurus TaxID=30522 RepID=UPI000F7D573D|nr:tripartite motif-containing protein 64C-like [Bos indicus x Bos taurus]